MIDQHLVKKANDKAYEKFQEVKKIKPIPKPENLDAIRIKRLAERELEKIAPKTGYWNLDEIIKGFIPGHLYTLTGDTNVGKTSLACNFAIAVARQGKRVLYIALEPDNTVIDYLASVYHDKCFDKLTNEDLNDSGLKELAIHVLGKEEIDSADRMIETINGLDRYDLIVIDHVGYFINSQTNYLQQQSNVVKQMVSVAKKKSCAVMLIAHLRKKDAKSKKPRVPTADDISGSAAFKQDSTEVMIAVRDVETNGEEQLKYTNRGMLHIVKTKSGPNGSIPLTFTDKNAKIGTSQPKTIAEIEKDRMWKEEIIQSAKMIFAQPVVDK